MTGAQFLTFCVALVAMLFLFATLYQLELAGKRLDAHLRELRELELQWLNDDRWQFHDGCAAPRRTVEEGPQSMPFSLPGSRRGI